MAGAGQAERGGCRMGVGMTATRGFAAEAAEQARVTRKKRRGMYNQRGPMHGKVEIVLREDVQNVGRAYETAIVARGFMRNFLYPRGHALYATKGNLKWAEQRLKERPADAKAAADAARGGDDAETLALPSNVRKSIQKKLKNPLVFVRRVDTDDRKSLDSAISRGDLLDACRKAFSLDIDPLTVLYQAADGGYSVPPSEDLDQPLLKTAGYHELTLEWGEPQPGHGRPLDPLVIMVIIEPTKDQQAAFEAEDAAREDLTGE